MLHVNHTTLAWNMARHESPEFQYMKLKTKPIPQPLSMIHTATQTHVTPGQPFLDYFST